MEDTDADALEASATATTENSSSGTSKRSREDEDDDSGPSSKVLKSSDDSDPPSEEEQQAIEAAKTAIENMKKPSGSEEETKPTEDIVPNALPPTVPDPDTPATEKDPQAEAPQPAQATNASLDSSNIMNTEASNEEAQKDAPVDHSSALPPQEVNVETTAAGEEPEGTSENIHPAPEAQIEEMNVEPSVEDQSKDAPQEQAPSQPVPAEPQVPIAASQDPQATMAAPAPGPTPPVAQEQVPQPQQQPASSAPQPDYVEESGQIAALYVGRVIGKGGEMIRDLQARSGAKMDVDSNVPPGQPRTITYAGTRSQVEFAKQLVNMLHQNVPEESLPLGHACQEMVIIPATGVGKVIGRGGEMIRELQSRSQAKIQVDHTGTSGLPAHEKQVSVTGTAEAVTKAREMVLFLVNNPLMEAQQSLNMLVEEKRSGASAWGSGPPYPNMPNQGMNMQPPAAPMDPYGGAAQYGGQGGYSQAPYGAQQQMQQPQQQMQQQPRADGAETMLASKQFMGRIIGSKGVTINDLQQRSGTHIQINQEVAGAESEITITGPPAGIRSAKGMIQEILASGPNHPYAGGGGGPGGGGAYGANPAGGMPGYPGGAGGAGGYHGSGYGGGGGYPGHGAMAGYGGGYPPQQQQHQQQSHQPPPQYGGYDTQAMAYGGYAGDPYGGGGGGGAPGGYGGAGGAPSGYGAAAAQYPGGAYSASGYGGQAAASYGAYGGAGGGAYGAPSGYSMPAPAPPAAAAAVPWKMATSPDGQVYYYNEQTGQTQWEKPQGIRRITAKDLQPR